MRWAGVTMAGGNGVAFSAVSPRWMLFLKTLEEWMPELVSTNVKERAGDSSVDHAESE